MKVKFYNIPFLICLFLMAACSSAPEQTASIHKAPENAEVLHACNKKLTDVMRQDIFSPPVASRTYAYANIAAYEILIRGNNDFVSLAGQLNDFTSIPEPAADAEIHSVLAAVTAFNTIAQTLVFSEEQIEVFANDLLAQYQKSLDEKTFENSTSYGKEVAKHVLQWASKDNYSETRNFTKYIVNNTAGRWVPTPPDYMDAVEPNWNKIRTFVLDSAQQFIPVRPYPFDIEKGSAFHTEMMEVYNTGKNLTDEQAEIASFWDCNPFATTHQGHLMIGRKKITPGGHWMGITAIACRQQNLDITQSAEAYALVAVSLADGFINCWDEKYRSNVIRPETVINRHIDHDWRPVLQTPPFPEYTSGHSVISTAASTMLTHLFGDNFSYTDTTEVEFGLKPRNFKSFEEAGAEAAISRLYGGIHYRQAIEEGVIQGKKIGNYITSNITTRNKRTASKDL